MLKVVNPLQQKLLITTYLPLHPLQLPQTHSTVRIFERNIMTIEPGTVIEMHSLKSAAGKEMNGCRGLVVGYLASTERYQIRLEFEEPGLPRSKALQSIKGVNLKKVERLALPSGGSRGQCSMMDMESLCSKLCELLVFHDGDYCPSDIMMPQYASMAFMRMGQYNFENFLPVQMEQIAAVLALASICREGEEPGTESVVFALLEGDTMYVDVLAQTLYWTAFIGEGEEDLEYSKWEVPPTKLTPDQETPSYAKTMLQGPLLLLTEASRYCFAPALWEALRQSRFYHLLCQRLLRLVAREGMNGDARKLGKSARHILAAMINVDAIPPIGDAQVSETILSTANQVLTSPEAATAEAINNLLGRNCAL